MTLFKSTCEEEAMCLEVTRSRQNIGQTTELERPYWGAPVTTPDPALHGHTLQFEARPHPGGTRLQDFTDSGPPGCAAGEG